MPNGPKKGASNPLLLKIFCRRLFGYQIIYGKFDVNMKKITRMVHIIIDGYNMIRQIPALSAPERVSLENGRKNLLSLLARYKRLKHHPVTVVFDGASTMSEFAPAGKELGISVRYSPENSSADEVIARLAQKEKNAAVIVSADRSVIDAAERAGAATLSVKEFYDRLLVAAIIDSSVEHKPETERSSRPTHKRWATKKKGNPRRLPKKNRRSSLVMRKI